MTISDSLCLTVTTLFRSTSFISMIYFTDVKPLYFDFSFVSCLPVSKLRQTIFIYLGY